ncbi:MAG: class I SAM-dependent methyltransferase [Nitrospinales bacterium]
MSLKDKEKWDGKYSSEEHVADRKPCTWLSENAHLLPGKGQALELAMGEGRNAVFAANLGYQVTGIDISKAGINNALKLAKDKKVNLKTIIADLDDYEFEKNKYDLILCFYFLNRNLFSKIKTALKPGGYFLCETFTVEHSKHSGLRRDWLLEPNELLREFSDFHIFNYREVDQNEKAVASLAGYKNI